MPLLEDEGRFIARVTAAELGEAQTGTPFVQLNFETDEGSTSGRVYLSEKAFERSLGVLKECFGFDGDFENLGQLKDQECSVTTEFEEYESNGETKQTLRVKWINPKGGPKMEQGARKTLAARLSAQAGFKGSSKPADNSDAQDEKDPF